MVEQKEEKKYPINKFLQIHETKRSANCKQTPYCFHVFQNITLEPQIIAPQSCQMFNRDGKRLPRLVS